MILESVINKFNRPVDVIDVGCGGGGLGKALSEKYDISRAYQILDDKEAAKYVVFNFKDFLYLAMKLGNNAVDEIETYGYWHAPAEGTVVEYSICA